MEVLGAVSSIVTIIETAGKLISLFGEVKNASHDAKRIQELLKTQNTTLDGLQRLLESQNGEHLATSQELRGALDNAQQQLEQVVARLQKTIEKTQPSGSGSGKRIKLDKMWDNLRIDTRSLEWPFQRKEMDGIVENQRQCQHVFSSALQIDSVATMLKINRNFVLSRLSIASGAAVESQANENEPRCHPDTRKDILARIFEWHEDPDGRCIFWLCGMAGMGKSTICRTIADDLQRKNVPIASYLFKKGEGDRGTATRFFTTLAAQIVSQVPCMASHVQDVIETDPSISDKPKKEQFDKLILKPLEACKGLRDLPAAVTIVVDALDECDRNDDARAIIHLFSIAKESLSSVRVRFFVTSRPDLHIRLQFRDIGNRHTDFALHEIPKPDIEGDIRSFLKWRLAAIRDHFNENISDTLASDWPCSGDVERLVGIAVPLFIFAATSCRFIEDVNYGDPEEQLEKILTSQRRPGMHDTYLPILEQLLLERTANGWQSRAQTAKEDIIQGFRAVVGSTVVLAEPLSSESLARLLRIKERTVRSRLEGLRSVLNIPKDASAPIRLLHLSFRDFLLDEVNRDVSPFWVDEQKTHSTLGLHCLALLSTQDSLKRDICDLRLPGIARSDIVSADISRCIPQEVQYACRYWVFHMKQGRCRIKDDDETHRFLDRHFLHWIEALSLVGRVGDAASMIDDLLPLLAEDNSTELLEFLRDAKRVILAHRRTWDEYPLQIYHSTLVFLPEKSVIREAFEDEYPTYLERRPRVDMKWDLCLQSFEIGTSGYEFNPTRFSPDSRLLGWLIGDAVEIRDVVTGALVMRAPGYKNATCGSFFSTGCTFAAAVLRPWQP